MQFKTLTWEEGLAGSMPNDRYPCIFATVLCVPNWFSRKVFKKKPWEVNVYGEKKNKYAHRWYNADTGHPLPEDYERFMLIDHMKRELEKKKAHRAAMMVKSRLDRAAKGPE